MRYPMRERSAQRVMQMVFLLFERPSGNFLGIWSYGTSDLGGLVRHLRSFHMACQSQKGIYWLDLADTILVDFGQYICPT